MPGRGDPDGDARARAEPALAEERVQAHRREVALDPHGLALAERAARPVAGDGDACAGRRVAHDQLAQPRDVARDLPARRDERRERREGERALVAVLVHLVAADLDRARPDLRVRVVAVERHRERVAVAVEVAVVLSVAVLVHAVLERVGRAGEDAGDGVVAVDGRAEPVAVVVRAALALGDDVGEVVVDPVVAGAAGDPLGVPSRETMMSAPRLAEVLVARRRRRRACRSRSRPRGRPSPLPPFSWSRPARPRAAIGIVTPAGVSLVVAAAEVDEIDLPRRGRPTAAPAPRARGR